MVNFPTSLDVLSNPGTADQVSATVKHSTHHANANDIVEALEAKVGITSSTPVASSVLNGTGTGTSEWKTAPTFTDFTNANHDHGDADDGGLTILAVVSKTTTYTATASDQVILCSASGGAWSLTLPTAVGITGKTYFIKKTDSSANAVTIDGNGTETIDGATTKAISTQYDAYTIVSDGANWHII